MRRKEKAITDKKEIESIIQQAQVCRLGFAVDNTPYVVPVNFGYSNRVLYIHCAKEGRKIDMIRQNNVVCFEMDVDDSIIDGGDVACKWASQYRSVIGYGDAYIVEDAEEKTRALEIIMEHYAGKKGFQYTEKAIQSVGIIKIEVTELSGKKST